MIVKKFFVLKVRMYIHQANNPFTYLVSNFKRILFIFLSNSSSRHMKFCHMSDQTINVVSSNGLDYT